jgi:imidazolonepropionase-like amidohydrolase
MDKYLAIQCGTLIDGTGNEPLRDAVIVVKNSKIEEVGEGITVPDGATVIEASDKTVIPGLIDGHVHLNADPLLSPTERLLSPDSLVNLRATKNAKKTLEAGFTSILGNCGYGNYADLFLREAIDNGWIPGPRLYTSGPGITSTLRRGINQKYGIDPQPYQVADGVEEVRRLVRRHIASGVDWIKVLATYAVGSPIGDPVLMNLNSEEINTLVAEAHAQNKKVKAHLEGSRTTKEALEAGIDIALHGFFLDDDDVEFMKKNDITFTPTLAWRGELVRTGAPGQPDWYLRKAKRYGPSHLASFKRAYEAGVRIAAGTDCSGGGSRGDFLRHGENALEMDYLVRNGLTPMEALMAGTKNVAEAYNLSHLIGTLEPGKLADIVIFDGDPLKQIATLQDKRRITTVIKNGEIVVKDGITRATRCPRLQPCSPDPFGG